MTLPGDYLERVYAGVLGKIIGVYLGRPFEGWSHSRIESELGPVNYYVNEKLGKPLVVSDDDISGTFTFLRALADYGFSKDITPAQIGQTWLNYLIEDRTVLWWGGLGTSTEHTAYLRLKEGILAPDSGSMALNGRVVAEQIGAQIFIDGWGMVAPGDPELAACLARRAASVSHDGEAIYGAQVIAALEAQAFVEDDLDRMLDVAVGLIARDSVIYQLIADVRQWHQDEPDWRVTRQQLENKYGYHIYGGGCHMVPNHALVILGLLYGEGNFQKALMVTNTSGWDTDCNSGNVGCFMGIWKGLAGIEAGPDWRTPVADRLLLPTADGGRCVTDALTEAVYVANMGRALAGLPPLTPKGGVRFHFELPGSLQGWQVEESLESRGTAVLENTAGRSRRGLRSLAVRYHHLATGRVARVATTTFLRPEHLGATGYGILASPTLYAGQQVRAGLSADGGNVGAVVSTLYVQIYETEHQLTTVRGPSEVLQPGAYGDLTWRIPDTDGRPIAALGIELSSPSGARVDGCAYVDYVDWRGTPEFTWSTRGGSMSLRAWTDGVDRLGFEGQGYRLSQNQGIGLAIQGARQWGDYRLSAPVKPHLVKSAGLAVRVQGMRRYYALLLCADQKVRLVKALDGYRVLEERSFAWQLGRSYTLTIEAAGPHLRAEIDGLCLFTHTDDERPLLEGAVAMVCEKGRTGVGPVEISPLGDP